MPDPLSVIAAAAAVGGLAGKVAERSWDSASSWLTEKFGSHAEAVREQAMSNSADFIDKLATRLRRLEEHGELGDEQISAAQRHPQFSALLQQAVLEAAQTEDSSRHDLLGALIAARLTVDADTTLALASSMATAAIMKATSRQLKLLGIMTFVDEIRPRHLSSAAHFKEWLGLVLPLFADIEFKQIDARHLASLACVTIDPTSERDLPMALNMKSILILDTLVEFEEVPGFLQLQYNWGEVLGTVQLTSVGSIVGRLVLGQLTNIDFPRPDWE